MSSSTKPPIVTAKRRKTSRAPTTCPKVRAGQRLRAAVQRISQVLSEKILDALAPGLPTDASGFRQLEEQLLRLCGQALVGPVVGEVLGALHASEPFVTFCIAQARQYAALRLGADREVELFVAGGHSLKLSTPYSLLAPERRPGPATQLGKRGAGGGGVYPVLGRLGFLDRNSPYVSSLVARLSAELDSFESARQALQMHGIELLVPQIQSISERVADAGRYLRELGLAEARAHASEVMLPGTPGLEARPWYLPMGPSIRPVELVGKRVVVLFDGGPDSDASYKTWPSQEIGGPRIRHTMARTQADDGLHP